MRGPTLVLALGPSASRYSYVHIRPPSISTLVILFLSSTLKKIVIGEDEGVLDETLLTNAIKVFALLRI